MALYLTKAQVIELIGVERAGELEDAIKPQRDRPGLAQTRLYGTPGKCFDARDICRCFSVDAATLLAYVGLD